MNAFAPRYLYRIRQLTLATACLFLIGFTAADSGLPSITQRLETYYRMLPQERFALHTDRGFYQAGDTVWFKLYALLEPLGIPDTFSNLAYVELVSPAGEVTQRHTLSLMLGTGFAQLTLPDTLNTGRYQLRAYTYWSLNFDRAPVYTHPIEVFNLFNEGCQLAADIRRERSGSRDSVTLAFRITDTQDRAVADIPVTVQVVEKRQRRPARVRTDASGRADLQFEAPKPDQHVVVELRWRHRDIDIKRQLVVPVESERLRIGVFPEGGEQVQGLESRVSVEVTNAYGEPRAVPLRLINVTTDSVLAQFSSDRWGLATCILTPEPGMRYAIVPAAAPMAEAVELPAAAREGLVLRGEARPEALRLALWATPELCARDEGKVVVTAMQAGIIRAATEVTLKPTGTSVVLPITLFETGVTEITLFTMRGDPLAERLMFAARGELPRLTLTPTGTRKPRGRWDVDLALVDSAGRPATADLSISVTDEALGAHWEAYPSTVTTDLLLQSHLRKRLANPAYFTAEVTRSRLAELDQVMRVYGWRRFLPKDVISQRYPSLPRPREVGSIAVSGRLTKPKGEPLPNVALQMIGVGKTPFLQTAITDSSGAFVFPGVQFEDTSTVIVKPVKAKFFTVYNFVLDSVTVPLTEAQMPTRVRGLNDADSLEQSPSTIIVRRLAQGEYELSDVVIRAKRPRPKTRADLWNKLYDDATPDKTIDFTSITPGPNALINELIKVPGLQISTDPLTNRPTITVRGVGSILNSTEPLYLFDGMQVDADFISTFPVQDLDHVDVLKGPSAVIYGSRGANGVIALWSRRGFSKQRPVSRTADEVKFRLQGFTSQRAFYSPAYDPTVAAAATNGPSKADTRTTLYWNPSLRLDGTGKGRFTFYQSDANNPMRITVQGITMAGQPVSQTVLLK